MGSDRGETRAILPRRDGPRSRRLDACGLPVTRALAGAACQRKSSGQWPRLPPINWRRLVPAQGPGDRTEEVMRLSVIASALERARAWPLVASPVPPTAAKSKMGCEIGTESVECRAPASACPARSKWKPADQPPRSRRPLNGAGQEGASSKTPAARHRAASRERRARQRQLTASACRRRSRPALCPAALRGRGSRPARAAGQAAQHAADAAVRGDDGVALDLAQPHARRGPRACGSFPRRAGCQLHVVGLARGEALRIGDGQLVPELRPPSGRSRSR